MVLDEIGIDRHEQQGEAVEIEHRITGKGIDPRAVEGADIDHRPVAVADDQGEPVGPADDGTAGVDHAPPIHEERTCVGLPSPNPGAKRLDHLPGEVIQGHSQGNGLHREEGDVAATGVTPLPAGELIRQFFPDSVAETVDPEAESTVRGKGIDHHTPPIFSAITNTKRAKHFLRTPTGSRRASLTPRGAVTELATAIPNSAGR